MDIKLNLIAAADSNMGIGLNHTLPWSIPSEFKYFLDITSPPHGQQNAVIIGRKTWETMGELVSRPFPRALNIVLSQNKLKESVDVPETVICASLEEAVKMVMVQNPPIAKVWILGGAQVYKAGLESPNFYRLYLTRIKAVYTCDSFFPEFKEEEFKRVSDEKVPRGIQTDKSQGINYEICVYERK